MTIRVQDLYSSKVRSFGMTSSEEVFQEQFIDAMNSVLGDLATECHIGQQTITSVAVDLDLGAKFWSAISDGVDVYLQDANNFSIKDKRDIYDRYRNKLKSLQVDYFEDSGNEVYAKLGDLS